MYDGWLQTLFAGPLPVVPAPAPGTEDDDVLARARRGGPRARRRGAAGRVGRDGPAAAGPGPAGPARPAARRPGVRARRRHHGSTSGRRGCATDGVLLELPLLGDPELPDEPCSCVGPRPAADRPRRREPPLAGRRRHGRRRAGSRAGPTSARSTSPSTTSGSRSSCATTARGEVRSFAADEPSRSAVVRAASRRPVVRLPARPVRRPDPDRRPGPGDGPRRRWTVWLKVEVAGFTVERPVTRLIRSGSAGVVPAAALADGSRADRRSGSSPAR